ncbi:uncharacterized protein EI90DRAFT_2459380 [Cantharellus anzutake]|uniref:uncharacterized protein n=1 Tax=Cantharellus anzutake TaxID=1750568 RepID=UPI00190736DC|nr:uncharacterized protein EI90DRAFT_2459380 [Cantharellus anzutake]KAF8339094.1 hypothetical protein EI90DRAFT_2459380 [Cantharellus anzutake]
MIWSLSLRDWVCFGTGVLTKRSLNSDAHMNMWIITFVHAAIIITHLRTSALDAVESIANELRRLEISGGMIKDDVGIATLRQSIFVIAQCLAHILTQSGQMAISLIAARTSPFRNTHPATQSIEPETLVSLTLVSLQALGLLVRTMCLSRNPIPQSPSIRFAHMEEACLTIVCASLQAAEGDESPPNLIMDVLEYSLENALILISAIEVTLAFLLRVLDEAKNGRVPMTSLDYGLTMAAPVVWELLARAPSHLRASAIHVFRSSSLSDLSAWIVEQQLLSIQTAARTLSYATQGDVRGDLLISHLDSGLACLQSLQQQPDSYGGVLIDEGLAPVLSSALMDLYEAGIQLTSAQLVCLRLCETMNLPGPDLPATVALTILRGCRSTSPVASGMANIHHSRAAVGSPNVASDGKVAASILTELGQLVSLLISEDGLHELEEPSVVAEDIVALIQWGINNHGASGTFHEGSNKYFHTLVSWMADVLPIEKLSALDTITANYLPLNASPILLPPIATQASLSTSITELRYALDPSSPTLPSTPLPNHDKDQSSIDNPGIMANLVSPPILRSPIISMGTLPKRYSNNDFRQIRQASSASRPPSTHVDDFTANGLASPLPESIIIKITKIVQYNNPQYNERAEELGFKTTENDHERNELRSRGCGEFAVEK